MKLNNELARVVAFAEQNNVPAKTIQNLIKNAANAKEFAMVVEARGPSESFFIIGVLTEEQKKTRIEINKILTSIGGAVLSAGGTRGYFVPKGLVTGSCSNLSLEDAEEIAILANAEEVKLADSSDDQVLYEFSCSPDDLHQVSNSIAESGLEIQSKEVVQTPLSLVQLTDAEKDSVEMALDSIRNPEYQGKTGGLYDATIDYVYDNIDW